MVHRLPTPDAGPVGITATADAVWFVEMGSSLVGRISPDGRISEFPLPDRDARPHAIVAAPDGGCWLSEWGPSRVAHVSPDGDVREVVLPASSEPHGLTVGPDGAVWVAPEAGAVARIDLESA
jgi:virginiamycin B lyase